MMYYMPMLSQFLTLKKFCFDCLLHAYIRDGSYKMLNNLLKYRQFGFSTQYRNLFNTCRSHHLQQNGRIFVKSFHCSVHMHSTDDTTKKDQIKHEIAPNIATKYERFTDDKATIILDMEEEREKLQTAKSLDVEVVDDTASHMFEGLNTERKLA